MRELDRMQTIQSPSSFSSAGQKSPLQQTIYGHNLPQSVSLPPWHILHPLSYYPTLFRILAHIEMTTGQYWLLLALTKRYVQGTSVHAGNIQEAPGKTAQDSDVNTHSYLQLQQFSAYKMEGNAMI